MSAATLPEAAERDALDFDLPPELEATEPPELTLGRRDAVRLMVSRGTEAPVHATAADLAHFLDPGDLVVVNTSATVPAAVDAAAPDGEYVVVHFSTELPTGLWLVEVRHPVDGAATQPHGGDFTGAELHLPGRATVRILGRMPASTRMWVASLALGEPVIQFLGQWGRPIRYRYVPATWPIDAYRNAYANEPGSAEMPSAGRPVTARVITSLASRGVAVSPLILHTGVASLEGNEMPYPERYRVPIETAERINETHAAGHRVVAIGTTVVRALETVTDANGVTHPGEGWTELVITPACGVRAVDGLLTGWHEPEATHLLMLEAVAGREPLELAYPEALAAGYKWHEFGDSHLLLPGAAVVITSAPAVTPTQRAVLYAIRRRGGITVEQLADALAITESGARQHLAALAEAGLVESAPAPRQPGQRGRTELMHHLTDAADPLFPKAYGELTNQLLGYLTTEAVDEVFDRRRDDRINAARVRLAGRQSFGERVAELAAILDEDGYLASFDAQPDGSFRVTEHNCAIIAVAREHPHACSSEIEFLRAALPEAAIERTTHMVSGAHSCTYQVRER